MLGMIRNSLSLRMQLILLLGAVVVAATGSLGSIAYNTSRAIIEGSAAREVGVIANARRQALIQELNAQNERAAALLKTVSLGCEPAETWCLRKVLADYVATGGATAARLAYSGRAPITVGKDVAVWPLSPCLPEMNSRTSIWMRQGRLTMSSRHGLSWAAVKPWSRCSATCGW